ncbi:MAG: DNA translocase FtsK [Clostridia bacterium]|nr:DNA translocase FtsK [Clostridia bacterium]
MASNRRRPGGQTNRAKTYSAEGLLAWKILGLLLIAAGVTVFLAVDLRLDGGVLFSQIRLVSRGLAGVMDVALPLLPLWIGGWLLLQSQRRMSGWRMLAGVVLFLMAASFMTMVTFVTETSQGTALADYLWVRIAGERGWVPMLLKTFDYTMGRPVGGGVIGMLLGYFLWRLNGPVLAGILSALIALAAFLVLIKFDFKRFFALLRGKREAKPQQKPQQQPAPAQWQNYARPPQPVQAQPVPVPVTAGFQPVPEETRYVPPQETGEPKRGIFGRIFKPDEESEEPVRRAARRPLPEEPFPAAPAAEETEDLPPWEPTEVQRRTTRQSVRTFRRSGEEEKPEQEPVRRRTAPEQEPEPIPKPEPAPRPEPKSERKPAPRPEPKPERKPAPSTGGGDYIKPPIELLSPPKAALAVSHEEDDLRARQLEETLSSFKVDAVVKHVTHGPAVSRFELEIASGIKVERVTSLGKNIAKDMAAKSVRIEAPIPGKSLIGIEVPNQRVETVTLREMLESPDAFSGSPTLGVALGKDIAGTPIICDLERMPHLLIAGATGSGKSVCINTIINSLLYRYTPEEVRMILVDPKVVELQCYNGVPHLLLPVVSEPRKASTALTWAVEEMEERYHKFQKVNVRSIDGYNRHLAEGEEAMPRIVIIIDELADLMMVCKRDVEDRICRIAQKARAAGIHLIIATQRPSVDVITGLIKANFPSRIAFRVFSNIDSRTILDSGGAEQLLGWGDMLYLPVGQFAPVRIQGCFLSDDDVNKVTEFIRNHSEPRYDPDVMDRLEHADDEDTSNQPSIHDFEATPRSGGNGDDSLLQQCIEIAVEDGQVSTSMLQRRLKVGYTRAGRLVDEMEKRGVVSQQDGSKPRKCLISREEWEAMKSDGSLPKEKD